MMMFVVRGMTTAYDLHDGLALERGEVSPDLGARTLAFRKKRAITKVPNLLEYLGNMYFFAGVIGGPVQGVREFLDFVSERNDYDPEATKRFALRAGASSASAMWTEFVRSVSIAIFSLCTSIFQARHYSLSIFGCRKRRGLELCPFSEREPEWLLQQNHHTVGYFIHNTVFHHSFIFTESPTGGEAALSAWFLGLSLPSRIIFLAICADTFRYRHHFVWNLTNVACCTSGFSQRIARKTDPLPDGSKRSSAVWETLLWPVKAIFPGEVAQATISLSAEASAIPIDATKKAAAAIHEASSAKAVPAAESAGAGGSGVAEPGSSGGAKLLGKDGAAEDAAGSSSSEEFEVRYDRGRNVDTLSVVFATNQNECVTAWNMGINQWLKHYIFERVVYPKGLLRGVMSERTVFSVLLRAFGAGRSTNGDTPLDFLCGSLNPTGREQISPILSNPRSYFPGTFATLVTRLFSAFWHGFDGGYYFFFASSVLVDSSFTVLRARLSPWWVPEDAPLKKYRSQYYSWIRRRYLTNECRTHRLPVLMNIFIGGLNDTCRSRGSRTYIPRKTYDTSLIKGCSSPHGWPCISR